MKINRKQLRQIILKEFSKEKYRGDIDDPSNKAKGGGGKKMLHQLICIAPGKGLEPPEAFVAVPIDISLESTFANMSKVYDALSEQTKRALYSITPGSIQAEDEDNTMQILDGYIDLINEFADHTQSTSDYYYFTAFHPQYVNKPSELEKKLELYHAVTGYSADPDLLEKYELVMHSASSLF